MKKVVIVLGVLLLVAGGWYHASPLWTLKAMRDAAVAKDGAALSHYVDYDALRSDLKGDMRRSMMAGMAGQPDNPFGAIGMAIAMKLVDPMIDAMVTPEGVQAMFAQAQAADAARSTSRAEAGGGGATRPGAPTSPTWPSLATAGPGTDPTIDRIGLDEFRVSGKPDDGTLTFRRHGLGWKLAGVDVPGV